MTEPPRPDPRGRGSARPRLPSKPWPASPPWHRRPGPGRRGRSPRARSASHPRLIADLGERLEKIERLFAPGDRKLEDHVPDAQARGTAEVGHDLFAHAPERRSAGGDELGALPSLLGRRLGYRRTVSSHLQSGAHRDLAAVSASPRGGPLPAQLLERCFELLEGLTVEELEASLEQLGRE